MAEMVSGGGGLVAVEAEGDAAVDAVADAPEGGVEVDGERGLG